MKPLLIFSLATGLVFSAVAQTKLPAPGKPKDFNLPAVKKWQLDNGLKASVVPYGSIPKVYIEIVVKTGMVHEPQDARWLARFTGKLMEEGSTRYNLETISKKAAAMGGRVTIAVGMETITIGGSVLSEFAPDYIALIADLLQHPAFRDDATDRLKNDLKRELNLRKVQPSAQANEKFLSLVFGDHPYASQLPTEAMVDGFSAAKAKQFYASQFGAERTAIYVAGKFDDKAVEKAIGDNFKQWAKGPAVSYPAAVAKKTDSLAIVERPDAPQTVVMLGGPVIDPTHADYTKLEVTNSLLGGSFGSRITTNIREDKGYTYSPFSTILNRQKIGVWYEKADVTSENTAASLLEIKKEMDKVQAIPVPADELKGIQNYEAGSFVITNSSAEGIINQLQFMDQNGLKMTYLTNRIKDIYSVTPTDVQAMAKKYLNYPVMTLVMVGDRKQIDAQLPAIRESRNAAKKGF
ncbi:M16 family metallopeptidase [Flavihumibacter petaseus]|uniref:Peptidase M16 family protein n=1 Tax=Flavihumibacter petaseus NBRC 106054 TaxID=1220578 RepID=A0A0E9MV48_9BACT|nr:pitrilysin family protein [Flavihumibacter petaseus]GAO41627.1 peptidase M16 family protein [Flavihumibacter petaseus NBRC 106054]